MNTGYKQWLRRWRVIIIPKSGGSGIDVSNLRCAFHIEKQLEETPNFSQIVITNPAVATINNIQPGDRVTVEAGYVGGNFGMIFSGEVVQPYIERDQVVDTNLVLVCQDGDVFLNSAFTAKSLEKGATALDVVNICAQGEGVSKGKITDKLTEQSPYIRGKVLFGLNADYLKRVAYSVSSQFYVEDSEINIISAEDYKAGTVVELNPDTGLVGDPSQTDDGVSAKCLINPSIKLNTLVHLSPETVKKKMVSKEGDKVSELAVDGVYRVVKMVYEGDTHGDDWYCTFEAVDQNASKGNGSGGPGDVSSYTTGEGRDGSVLHQGLELFRG